MNKTISVLFNIIMLACSFSIVSYAKETPLIVVTGYGTPALFENYGEWNQKHKWIFSPVDALCYTLTDLQNVLPATADFIKGKGESLSYCISQAGKTILPYMYCNSDGTSVADIEHVPNIPKGAVCADLGKRFSDGY